MTRHYLILASPALLALFLLGCRTPKPAGSAGAGPNLTTLAPAAFESVSLTNDIRPEWLHRPNDLFRLGPGDVLEIEDLGQPQPGGGSVVLAGPDGKIYFSLLPGLSVWGLTLSETKEMLETELNRYTRAKPSLAVILRAVGSKHVWILGSVQAPGLYSLAAPLTILEAISRAGGVQFTPGSSSGMPDLDKSFLMRDGAMLHLDLHRLLSQGDLSQNIYLQPDDFLYLQSAGSRSVYVLGAVATPNVINYHDKLSLLSALANSGGTIAYANVTHVAIIRGSLSSPKIAGVDFKAIERGNAQDILLEAGDIVYVPFVPYRRLGILVEQMIGTLVRTIAANEGRRAVIPGASPIGVTGSVPFQQTGTP